MAGWLPLPAEIWRLTGVPAFVLYAVALGGIAFGIHFEERNLQRAIGPAYEEYRRQVRAVLPLRVGRR